MYVGAGRTGILVDAGVSCARVVSEMKATGIDPAALSAILITHEHSDHVAGAGILSRKFDLPIYATEGTWSAHGGKAGRGEREEPYTSSSPGRISTSETWT